MGNYVFDREVLVDSLRARTPLTRAAGTASAPTSCRCWCGTARRTSTTSCRTRCPGPAGGTTGYWREVGTLDSYFAAHMDLCAVGPGVQPVQRPVADPDPRAAAAAGQVRLDEDESGRVGRAVSSVVSNGVIVSGGLVRESVLSPGVRVDNWACVERAVVLHNARIGRRAVVRDAILDKNVVVTGAPRSGWTRSATANAGSRCPAAASPWSARDRWSNPNRRSGTPRAGGGR